MIRFLEGDMSKAVIYKSSISNINNNNSSQGYSWLVFCFYEYTKNILVQLISWYKLK